MGIGRREFLKLCSAALAGLAVDPLQAVVTNDNLYINKQLGILFYKPNEWDFLHVQDFGKLRAEQILANGYDAFKEELFEDIEDPICIATKYAQDRPELKGIFSPTISLQVTHQAKFEEETFEDIVANSEDMVSCILRDHIVTRRHEPYLISGVKFYETDAEYLFEHVDIDAPLKAELKVLKAEHNGYYYFFNCHQSKAQGQGADREFEAFKQSIRLI